MRSSGVARRMLDDVCGAVETTARYLVGDGADRAREVLEEYPRVVSHCDQIAFDEWPQALAYLMVHLPDRYCRMFQVLERLLVNGKLPIGKTDGFAAIDIGAGPGPGIFAVRSFYAALAHYAKLHGASLPIVTLGYSHIVERGRAMPRVMHYFAESLVVAERGHPDADGIAQADPNPCATELASSFPPFQAHFTDFTDLDIPAAHHQARMRLAAELYHDDFLELTRAEAKRLAYEGQIDRPSAYALAVMMNFLTPGSDALTLFSEAIDRLMHGALVPGGTILVLGATSADYEQIYADLDSRARAAGLSIADGFDRLFDAGHQAGDRAAVRSLTRRLWDMLEPLAGDVGAVKDA